MRIPEENRSLVLLATVTLFTGLLALIAAAFEPESSNAQTTVMPTVVADQTPVRVVGPPLVLNTNPREHR